ncbi:NAD(P)H-hydrate dehydratase [Nakamurella sp. GG22]
MPSRADDPAGATGASQVLELTEDVLRNWRLPPLTGSGKESRGDVFIVGGAAGTPGAAILAGVSALRVGAGRLTLAVASSVAGAVAVQVPESGVVPLPESDGTVLGRAADVLVEEVSSADALLIGSGLDHPDETAALLERLATEVPDETKVVLDAFALGVLNDVPAASEKWSGRLVLTPNVTELERLTGLDDAALDEPEALPAAVRTAASRFGAVVTCHNVIADPDGRCWQASPNCIGLGTSGSGDVLAGAIAGLLARGADPIQAACWGTYLHLHAGHRLAARTGTVGFLARELMPELPVLLEELHTDPGD